MGEIKQTNFRIDSESADAFRQFCEEQGYNQAQGFDHMIQVLELNRAKAGIAGRLTEITTFEEYVKKLMGAYLTSLQVAQETEERVREDFETDISLRDKALAENEYKLQKKDEKIEQLTSDMKEYEKIAKESAQATKNAEKQAASAVQIAEEKGKINDMLSAKLAEAEAKIAGYGELKTSEEKLKKQLDEMIHKQDMLQAELEHVNVKNKEIVKQLQETGKTLEDEKEKVTGMKIQIASLQRDLEEEQRSAEQRLAVQKRESAQAMELAVERSVRAAEKDMQEQIAALRDEKTRLQVQLELLKQARESDSKKVK